MKTQHRYFPLFVLLGTAWVIILTISADEYANWVRTAMATGGGPFGATPSLAGTPIMSVCQAVSYSSFGYVIAAVTLVAWLDASPWIRYAHLMIAMLVTTFVLAAFEYVNASLLSDEKLMAFGIASRNQWARVWYCTITVFVSMRFISLASGVVIETPESERDSRRFGVGHLMRLTAILAVLFLSISLLQDGSIDSFADLRGNRRTWLWLSGIALVTSTSFVSWIHQRRKNSQPDARKTRRTIVRWASLIAAAAVLIGSTQWFDYFSDNFMAWFQIDWSIPNPIPVRGQAWDILPQCVLASLALCVPLSCAIWSIVDWRGKIAFALATSLPPIWAIVTPMGVYPIALFVGIFLTVLPTMFAAWRLLRSGYQVKL